MINPNESETGGSSSININRRVTMEMSIGEASSIFPGFRFSPTDVELIQYYLNKKIESSDEGVQIIPQVDICKHEPWDLSAESIIPSNNEWFFFSTRGRKYPSGSQSKRATAMGYWKATGKERNVKSNGNIIGTKRTLVFHTGRAPKGQRTGWIMHEYCTIKRNEEGMVVCRLKKNEEFHLNDNTRRDSGDDTPININTTLLSGGEQSGMQPDMQVVGEQSGIQSDMQHIPLEMSFSKEGESSFSKEGESNYKGDSYNSHSVEQVVSEESDEKIGNASEESDEKIANEFLHHGSSSFNKSYIEDDDCFTDMMNPSLQSYIEEDDCYTDMMNPSLQSYDDCYTDIMKDDIITLDNENFGQTPIKLKSEINFTAAPVNEMSSQGTAIRRIRLRRHKSHRRNSLIDAENDHHSQYQQRSFTAKIKYPSIFLLCLILLVVGISIGWNRFPFLDDDA